MEDSVSDLSVIADLCVEVMVGAEHMHSRSCSDQLHVGCRHDHIVCIDVGQDASVTLYSTYAHYSLSQGRVSHYRFDFGLKVLPVS